MKLAVIAGEASGDLHASEVVRELRQIDPDLTLFGLGGDLLQAQGMELLSHARDLGIVGLFNVLRHLGMFRRVFRELLERIERERPDAVLLVDYPDFNLRLAGKVKALGIPVIYYISPQVWAWRKRRVATIARVVDQMLVIFPFEESFYRARGVPVTWVGHPLTEQLAPFIDRPRSSLEGRPVSIALMPGSRRMEVESLLPAMLDGARILGAERSVSVHLIQAPTIDRSQLDRIIAPSGVEVTVVSEERRAALASSDLAISSSGTATLEAAILGVPVVVVYRLSRATYQVARWLVKLPDFSLVNIMAGERVVPELLQDEVNGASIAAACGQLLDPSRYQKVVDRLGDVRRALGERGASRRAAEEIVRVVRSVQNVGPGGP